MIRLTDYNDRARYVAASSVTTVAEAGPSSQYHGIRSIVKTVDGTTIESKQDATWIVEQVRKALEKTDV